MKFLYLLFTLTQFQLQIICCYVRNFQTSERLLNFCEIVSSTLAVFLLEPQVKKLRVWMAVLFIFTRNSMFTHLFYKA